MLCYQSYSWTIIHLYILCLKFFEHSYRWKQLNNMSQWYILLIHILSFLIIYYWLLVPITLYFLLSKKRVPTMGTRRLRGGWHHKRLTSHPNHHSPQDVIKGLATLSSPDLRDVNVPSQQKTVLYLWVIKLYSYADQHDLSFGINANLSFKLTFCQRGINLIFNDELPLTR